MYIYIFVYITWHYCYRYYYYHHRYVLPSGRLSCRRYIIRKRLGSCPSFRSVFLPLGFYRQKSPPQPFTHSPSVGHSRRPSRSSVIVVPNEHAMSPLYACHPHTQTSCRNRVVQNPRRRFQLIGTWSRCKTFSQTVDPVVFEKFTRFFFCSIQFQ